MVIVSCGLDGIYVSLRNNIALITINMRIVSL